MSDEGGMSDRKPRFILQVNWKITVFCLLMLPFLLSLGVWQLNRAEQKQTIQQLWLQQQAQEPASLSEVITSDKRGAELGSLQNAMPDFRRVRGEGQFLQDQYWLLEGGMFNGQLGYHVIMPFVLAGVDNVVIVNRGWVRGSPRREVNPTFSTPNMELTISGVLVEPSDLAFVDQNSQAHTGWPSRILEVDIELMREQLGRELLPKMLQIDADNPAALTVLWQPINMSPARHIGYAVQWFSMALVLCVLWCFANSNINDYLRSHLTRKPSTKTK